MGKEKSLFDEISGGDFCSHRVLKIASRMRRSHVATEGHSASISWNKVSIWGLRPDFYYCQKVACLLLWSALSFTRGPGLSFTIASGYRLQSHCWVPVP
jgi:hypothetical protein